MTLEEKLTWIIDWLGTPEGQKAVYNAHSVAWELGMARDRLKADREYSEALYGKDLGDTGHSR